ncbi:MAG: bifunctional folylpolyglutamate synthase/dihydrofolate synthase [Bacteroidia bacterium]|nr:bifunctional folylpolyglutamate synthase/dihydrofolate synthase [Bacteroidia bacterium]
MAAWQQWLYGRLRAYELNGRKALHPTLEFMKRWDALLGHPHRRYPIIHVAGTNGKGSTSAFLASILQAAGYRVGLHTSPHFWYFTERMRVNGAEPPEAWVEGFLSRWKSTIEDLQLSFFEATVGMSLAYFAEAGVDVAVVEVGLGGLWDATNIVEPLLSVITPIGWDHVEILGPTIADIARQKGGIIKPGCPVVVSPQEHEEVLPVLRMIAQSQKAPITEAHYRLRPTSWILESQTYRRVFLEEKTGLSYTSDLTGDYQAVNIATVLSTVEVLESLGWKVGDQAIREGLASAGERAPIWGRAQWIVKGRNTFVLDVAHNPPAFAALRRLINNAPISLEGLIIGFSQDKDIEESLRALGGWEGPVFFAEARNPRALGAHTLQRLAEPLGYKGTAFGDVVQALQRAMDSCQSLLITGSIYLVAEALSAFRAPS